jgi:hypothetical protein
MLINLVPILLGGGERLFDGLADRRPELEPIGTITAPGVTHLRFRVG